MASIVPLFGGEARLTVKADGADLTAGQLVKITNIDGTVLEAVAATAPGEADGVMNVDVANGEKGACIMLVPGTVMKMKSGAGVAAGELVEPVAAGAADTASAFDRAIGRALTATASGFILVLVN
jgi:hypothetical protein